MAREHEDVNQLIKATSPTANHIMTIPNILVTMSMKYLDWEVYLLQLSSYRNSNGANLVQEEDVTLLGIVAVES